MTEEEMKELLQKLGNMAYTMLAHFSSKLLLEKGKEKLVQNEIISATLNKNLLNEGDLNGFATEIFEQCIRGLHKLGDKDVQIISCPVPGGDVSNIEVAMKVIKETFDTGKLPELIGKSIDMSGVLLYLMKESGSSQLIANHATSNKNAPRHKHAIERLSKLIDENIQTIKDEAKTINVEEV